MGVKRSDRKNVFQVMLFVAALFWIFSFANVYADTIIDNGDPGTSFTGTWNVSGGLNPWDPSDSSATSLWSRDGDTYTWTFTPTDSGYYDLSMWWTQYSSRSDSIPVLINYWRGTDTKIIDEQQDGGQWNLIDTYPFQAGVSYDITMTAVPGGSQNYSTCADAVQLVYQPGLNVLPVAEIYSISPNPALTGAPVTFTGHGEDLDGSITEYRWHSSIDGDFGGSSDSITSSSLSPGTHIITLTVVDDDLEESAPVTQTLTVQDTINEVIIDNGDPETSFTGSWGISGGSNPWGATSLWSRDGDTYTWTFTPPVSGQYDVSIWYTQYTSRSDSVPLQIEYAGGTDTVVINQKVNGGQWNSINTYPFEAGIDYHITVTAQPAPASTCADAVKFTYLSGNVPPVATIGSISPSPALPTDTITLTGSGTGDNPIIAWEWRSDIDGPLGSGQTINTTLSEGIHTIFFKVQDDQGIWSPETTAIVVVHGCNAPLRIMPLGDSNTYGNYHLHTPPTSEYVTGYRQPLFQSLKNAGYYFDFVGGNVAGELASPIFDPDHEGHAGWYADEVESNVYDWLVANPTDVVLLHIGTNDISDNNQNVLEVAGILDEIDRYEANFNTQILVVLARIINRDPISAATTLFNDQVQAMAENRIANGDKIIIVDQEHALTYPDDLYDEIHPNETGFNKMANVWLNALSGLLPICSDFGPFGPFIFTSPTTEVIIGQAYTYHVGALGDPAPTYSLPAGVAGMTIDPNTGEISWMPVSGQEGLHAITVQAQNSAGTVTQDFNINVSEGIIIDNGDPETSFTGSWSVSGGPMPWDPAASGATSLWSRDGATYTWTFTPPVSGQYDASIWYTQYTSRSDSVPVLIEYSGGTDNVTINQQINGGQWNLINTYPFEAGVAYNVTVTAVPGGTQNYSTCADAVKFVLASVTPPSITAQPSGQTVTVGQTATFSVAATGSAPLSYQWQKDGTDITGANSASYTTSATVPGDDGASFRCVVTNSGGSATSAAAVLTVIPGVAPSITTQPLGQTVPEGSTATFSVTAAGSAPMSYQWQKDGSNITGATGASYTTPATVPGDDGALFHCVVTNGFGSATSNDAALTVQPVGPSITTQPSSQTVTVGQTATFSVAATGSAPLSYQWQKDGTDITGANSASYTTPATVPGDDGASFRCVVTNSGGSATSAAAVLTVTAGVGPSITTQPSSQTVTVGQTATFSVAATGTAPLSYQWQKNGSDISGANSASYTTPVTVPGDDGTSFQCVVTNGFGSDTSAAAVLTVVVSEAPTAFNDKMDTLLGVPVTIDVVTNDSDSDGTIDPTTVSITQAPANGTAVQQGDGTVLYTPNTGYSGKDTFKYTVQDDQGVLSNEATVTVTVGIVIDNGDPETSSTGFWGVSGGPDPWNPAVSGATSLWSRDGATYTWTFTPDVAGNYEISIWYTYVSSRSESIPLTIENWSGTATTHVNQQTNAGQWNSVGTYPFQAGVSYKITITSVPGGTENYSTCADAVRFVHIPTNVAPLAVIDSMTSSAAPGQPVAFSGSGMDFEGPIAAYSWYSTLDGPLSDQASFSTTGLSEGVHTIFFKVQDADGAWSPEVQASVDINDTAVATTEHIFIAPGYATVNATPLMVSTLQSIGATQSGGLWYYTNNARNKNYIIHFVHTEQEWLDALKWQDAVVLYFGHSNYGSAQLFATDAEFNAQVIDDIRYVDDDRLINISSPIVHVSISGMRTGQAYPHWWYIYKDGTDARVPYDFGDPSGRDPAYNYYITYQVPGDPTHYKIQTVRRSAVERFSDSGVEAWYDPDGNPPDPNNPNDLKYYITNPEPWSPSIERIGNWVDTNVLSGFYRENYEYSTPGSGANQMKWLFSIPEEGDYHVYVWYPASSTNSTNAPFTVNYEGGSTTVPVNQRLNGGQWNMIGTYHFGVADYSVVLTDNASGGNVVADGVRVEHANNPPEVLKAHFFATNRSGPAPLDVLFRGEALGDVDHFEWNFGDGNTNATRTYITHTYTQPGTYTVTFTVSGPLGTDSRTEVGYIVVGDSEEPLKAEFESRSSQTGTAPSTIQFRDRSSGDIVSWAWDFDGDGTVDSTEQSPSFEYTVPGIYTVSLTVTDSDANTDTQVKQDFIRIVLFDKNIDNVDYPKTHFRSKTLLYRKGMPITKEEMKYARMFYGGCDSGHYYTDVFQRGIFHYATNSTGEGEYAMAEYLKAYVGGKSDYEIWQIIQAIEPLYDYYDFSKTPSEQY